MKSIKLISACLISSILLSFNSPPNVGKIVGWYKCRITQRFRGITPVEYGGDLVSQDYDLVISKDVSNNLKYQIICVSMTNGEIIDNTNDSGLLRIDKNILRFDGDNEYGSNKRGAYIEIPLNGWSSAPLSTTVKFNINQGGTLEFKRVTSN
jgi:hypothetical protein